MATERPRFSVTFSEDSFEKIKKYQEIQEISTQSKAVARLVEIALTEIESDRSQTEENDAMPFPSSEAMKLATDYDSLDGHGQRIVRLVTDEEKNRMELEAKAQADSQEAGGDVVYITQYYRRPMSAGTGQEAGDNAPESLHLKKEPPPGTSYVAPVSGDSMEPTYHDGDLLFIRYQEEICPGQIGVFFMDGQQWIKELGNGVLISHNSAYPPRTMTEDIRCQGRILGICDESYFE